MPSNGFDLCNPTRGDRHSILVMQMPHAQRDPGRRARTRAGEKTGAVMRWSAASVVAAVGLSAGPVLAQPAFHTLGFLDPTLGGPSIAYAISADGLVVVGMSNSSDGFQAFRWTLEGGMVGLGSFPNPVGFPSSQALAVSADGSVIGGASGRPNSLNEDGSPFRWTQATGLIYLGSLGGTEGGETFGVSPDGSILVGFASSSDFNYDAFKWTVVGGIVALPRLANQVQGKAIALSADGSQIVGSIALGSPTNPKPARWSSAGPALLPSLNASTIGAALAVTPDGATIVGQSAGRAVRWTEAGIENLGLLPGGSAATTYSAAAVSANGSVIVGLGDFNATQGTGTAIIWDAAHGVRELDQVLTQDFGLDLRGFHCFWARAISADGLVIAGYGFGLLGDQEAFVADLHSGVTCYPNCDHSTTAPVLNVADFSCFLNAFAAGDSYANCDASTTAPVLNVADFSCFLNAFAAGCS
jgi:probable HAF family extracellular repeat protein